MYLRSLILLAFLTPSLIAQKPDVLPLPKRVEVIAAKQSEAKPKALAAEPELIGATTFQYLAEFKVRNVPQGTAIIWDVYPDDTQTVTRIIKVEKACVVAGPPRQYKIKVRLVKGEDVSQFEKVFNLTGGGTIDPKVDPKVDPKPDNPVDPKVDPPPSPAPIPEVGFRVLMAYQDKDKNKMSASQRYLLSGGEVRDYLEAKTVAGADGQTKEYRIWDIDVKGIENESRLWQAAWARPHPTIALIPDPANPAIKREVPTIWLIVSNGKEGWEGPILPTMTNAEIMAILKKYGG